MHCTPSLESCLLKKSQNLRREFYQLDRRTKPVTEPESHFLNDRADLVSPVGQVQTKNAFKIRLIQPPPFPETSLVEYFTVKNALQKNCPKLKSREMLSI